MIESPTIPETLSIPVDNLRQAEVRIGFGAGELTLGQAEPGVLVAGTFDGGVIQKSIAPGRISLEQFDPGRAWIGGCERHWDVQLTAEIPLDLRLDTGANRSNIDLASLRVRRVDIHTGASETNIRVPAAGQTAVHISCGYASVNVEVPQGVAAHIRGKIALGATDVDEVRFPKVVGGWASPDYDVAEDRVEIEVEGGFGSVKIR